MSRYRKWRPHFAGANPAACFVLLMLSVMFWAPNVEAVEIFFNGVKVTGLSNQKFDNCEIRFDGKGNLHIKAKGYTVKTVEDSAASRPAGATSATLKARYYLVSMATQPPKTQFDVDLFANGKFVRKVKGVDAQGIYEISAFLKPGKNLLQFGATKNYRGHDRLSKSKDDYLRLLVGTGVKGRDTVNITKVLLEFRIAADEVLNRNMTKEISVD
jgi:hypothetical protein